jgi:hypothetical protein
LEIPAEARAAILSEVKKRAIAKRGLLTDAEFRKIADGVAPKKAASS